MNQSDNNEHVNHQLDRIEAKVDKLVARIDSVEKRASFWGALGGAAAMIATHLTGCLL